MLLMGLRWSGRQDSNQCPEKNHYSFYHDSKRQTATAPKRAPRYFSVNTATDRDRPRHWKSHNSATTFLGSSAARIGRAGVTHLATSESLSDVISNARQPVSNPAWGSIQIGQALRCECIGLGAARRKSSASNLSPGTGLSSFATSLPGVLA